MSSIFKGPKKPKNQNFFLKFFGLETLTKAFRCGINLILDENRSSSAQRIRRYRPSAAMQPRCSVEDHSRS